MARKSGSALSKIHQGKREYVIAMRKPWHLPDGEIQLPAPEAMPKTPSQLNLLTLTLPPLLLITVSLIVSRFVRQISLTMMLPMALMSLGYPIANLISNKYQQKKYKEKMAERETKYISVLRGEKVRLDNYVREQKETLAKEFPCTQDTIDIGLSRGSNKRLWWRRRHDNDYLRLRAGIQDGEPSFTILPPKMKEEKDPLNGLPYELIERFEEVTDIPLWVDLKRAGSLVIRGNSVKVKYEILFRLLLDLIVHHSPEDIELVLFSDSIDSAPNWEWLKWTPHTHAMEESHPQRNLIFSIDQINNYIVSLNKEIDQRFEKQNRYSSDTGIQDNPIIIILDDTGVIRRSPDIAQIASVGFECGVYLIFVGERGTPSSCRAQLDVTRDGEIRYLETWESEGRGGELIGEAEITDVETCEQVARALASLEVSGGKASHSLPSLVRISQILSKDPLSIDSVISNWEKELRFDEQVLFPLGYYVDQFGLESAEIDFRPEVHRGLGEYHALLVGTTGSGKSILLQTMVLAAAHKYSPKLINFLFMDFKAGAAELKKISDLPHVVGMITDLSPELAERALQALENELSRRQIAFDKAGKITDIWDYNRRFTDNGYPHLMVVVDEFAEGIKILPDLVERLRDLGRRGRAFGMYFFLANQEVNSAVESLKPNVGWYIVLKVKRTEEMSLIDKSLPISPGKGRGYFRVKSDITTFQTAFAGMPVVSEQDLGYYDYSVFQVNEDGGKQEIYTHSPHGGNGSRTVEMGISELDMLLDQMNIAAEEMSIERAKPIYLDPISPDIALDDVLEDSQTYRSYNQGDWSSVRNKMVKISAPIGYLDIPDECIQIPLMIDFKEADGHLWVVGNPGTGKSMALRTLMLSMAYCHRPDEVQFYVLDFGDGSLRSMENLPHTGSVIRVQHRERIERLLRYIDAEITRRTEVDWREQGDPDIFIIINNYAEIRSEYRNDYDVLEDELAKFVRTGKATGIHLVFATNRGSELKRNISSNISRKVVLQLASRDDYLDVLGQFKAPLSMRVIGRGFTVDEGVFECQIAHPVLDSDKDPISALWDDTNRPKEIRELADSIPYQDVAHLIRKDSEERGAIWVPIGVSFETMDLIQVDLNAEIPYWLVLGPRQSGKSNFLLMLAEGIKHTHPDLVEINGFALRRTSFAQKELSTVFDNFYSNPTDIETECKRMLEDKGNSSDKPLLMLVDDVGGAFEPGNEQILSALNNLAQHFSSLHNTFLVASGMRDEMQVGSQFVKFLRQSRSGLALSKDGMDLDWFGVHMTPTMRKVELPTGRGYHVSKAKTHLVQVPLLSDD